ERSADAHGFHVFDFAHPSVSFRAAIRERRAKSQHVAGETAQELKLLIDEERAASILELRVGGAELEGRLPLDPATTVTRYEPSSSAALPPGRGFDGVIALEA